MWAEGAEGTAQTHPAHIWFVFGEKRQSSDPLMLFLLLIGEANHNLGRGL